MAKRSSRPTRSSAAGAGARLRRCFGSNYSLAATVITIAGVVGSGIGFVAAVSDTEGENPLSYLMFFGPAIAGAFPTLELIWDPEHDLSRSTLLRRWLLFPVFGAIGAALAMGLVEITLRLTGALAAAQAADKWHYWFPADGPAAVSVMFGLLGYAAGVLVAMAVFVVILWPLQILLRPRQAIEENHLDTAPEHFRRNRAALTLMPLLVLNAVVIGIALTFEIGWLAVASVVLEIAMVVVTVRLQRPKPRRGSAGQRP